MIKYGPLEKKAGLLQQVHGPMRMDWMNFIGTAQLCSILQMLLTVQEASLKTWSYVKWASSG